MSTSSRPTRPTPDQPTSDQPAAPATDSNDGRGAGANTYVGPETWVREAIAEQEEHIKRWRSCTDMLGRSHTYTDIDLADLNLADSPGVTYRACAVCGVAETREDYQVRLAAIRARDSADRPTH